MTGSYQTANIENLLNDSSAVRDEYSQCRKICVKTISYKNTRETVDYEDNDYFMNINFI